ncbi:MAG: TRAP transporter substrate-binding protein DctP [Hyphomicrobiaceae bacterium]
MRHAKAILASVVMLAVTAAAASAGQTKTLRFMLQFSESNPLGRNILEFAREVETRTDGAVKIATTDMQMLYGDNEVPWVVGTNVADMGLAPLGQYLGDVPAAGFFAQPFVFNFDTLVHAATKPGSEIRAIIDSEILDKTGTHILWWLPYGATVGLSKAVPINDPAGLHNQKVLVFDGVTEELVRACGGDPFRVSTVRQFSAFEMGIVDGSMTGVFSLAEGNLWRATGAITKTHHAPLLFVVVINRKVWESLSNEQQHILTAAARAAQERMWDRFPSMELDAYISVMSKGIKTYELTGEDIKAWRICSSSLLESYVERAGAVGAKLFAAYARLRTDPCCNVATAGASARGR